MKLLFKHKKTKVAIDIFLLTFGLGLSCISFVVGNEIIQGVVFSLGISLSTTMLIDIYQIATQEDCGLSNASLMGLVEVDYNGDEENQKEFFRKAKKMRLIFSSGNVTLQRYEQEIIESIIQNNCVVQIIISNDNVLRNDIYLTDPKEWDITERCIDRIIEEISEEKIACRHSGCIELRRTSAPPIAFLQIKDDSYCIVSPYMYKARVVYGYHSKYVNTKKKNDVFSKWEHHFENVWNESEFVKKYES